MRLGLLLVTSAVLLTFIGCQSKQSCLQKYHFNSCEEFLQVFAKTNDSDEALKMHSISIECGCKPPTEETK
jgi:hypothetical protein